MKIVVIGGGYVGLVSGVCFAEIGHQVTIVESDAVKLASLRQGRLPIYEPGLDSVMFRTMANANLVFSDSIGDSLPGAEVVFIAVGTPTRHGDGHADLRYVYAAAEQIALTARAPTLVVTKSTVPVGTGRKLKAMFAQSRPDLTIDVASNPEFLREGNAVEDFMRPDRIIIGVGSMRSQVIMHRLYAPLLSHESGLIVFTSLESAEMTKYAANSFLAMKVAFVNELADICERVGADISAVTMGMGLDARIGERFLNPGPGFGGSCFPKDTLAMARIAQDAGAPSRLVETVIEVNDARKSRLAQRVIDQIGSARGKTIAVLGLAFKAETDDMRDSPAIPLVSRLIDEGADIRAYDPAAMEQARLLFGDKVALCPDAMTAMTGADAAVIVTEWKEFAELNPDAIAAALRGQVLVDFRNMFAPVFMKRAGLNYVGVGRILPTDDSMVAEVAVATTRRLALP